MCEPFPFSINKGVPPTLLKARTGEFTPPGKNAFAFSNNFMDSWFCMVKNLMAKIVVCL